jgi:hypothetical protein
VNIQQDGERWACRICQTKHNKARWQQVPGGRGQKGHRWTSEEARDAGRKGGQA